MGVIGKMNNEKIIVERELLYSLKEHHQLKKCAVQITAPYLLEQSKTNFQFDEGTAGCMVKFFGVPENDIEVYGMDSLHALTLALDIDSYLKGLSKKYNFFWKTGEPYFDE